MTAELALRIIRSLESDAEVLGAIIINRRSDPRWRLLNEAYAVLQGAWRVGA